MQAQILEESPNLVLARYHSPALGRFLCVDPGFDVQVEDPQSWNLYAYVRNNPVGRVDPDGRISDEAATDYFQVIKTEEQFNKVASAHADGARIVGEVSDPTKTGSATAYAVAAGESKGGVAAAVVVDAVRATNAVGLARAGAALLTSGLSKLGSAIRSLFGGADDAARGTLAANPFKGKSPAEVGGMLEGKGYSPRGPDPVGSHGDGTPVSQRHSPPGPVRATAQVASVQCLSSSR